MARLLDQTNLQTGEREWLLLLRDCFSDLPGEERRRIVEGIAAGPIEHKQEGGEIDDEDDAEQERWRRWWTYRRLAVIAGHLDGEWLAQYRELETEFGEPDTSLRTHRLKIGDVPLGPIDPEDLAVLSVPEVVALLQAWVPPGSFASPTRSSFGLLLGQDVQTRPEAYASKAQLFCGLDPTYVRSLVFGLQEAAKSRILFPWPLIVELCRWAVDQPLEIAGRADSGFDEDPSWSWARREIAQLFVAGLRFQGGGAVPFDQRENVWHVLQALANDPDPVPTDESYTSQGGMTPFDRAINSVRGNALQAVIMYAWWVRENLGGEPGALPKPGAALAPEAFALLDAHLDPAIDVSSACRAVYGVWLPQLVTLDQDWVRTRLGRLFPDEVSLERLRNAAWQAYLVFARPYRQSFRILKDEYRKEVMRLPTGTASWHLDGGRTDPRERLGEHLVALYRMDELDLDDPDGLLATFYDAAPPAVAAHLADELGRELLRIAPVVTETDRDRLIQLWEARLAAFADRPTPERRGELAAFGTWFASGAFNDAWSLSQLASALTLAGRVEFEHRVAQRLADLAPLFPAEVVACVDLIVSSHSEQLFRMSAEAIEAALASILRSENVEAKERAETVVGKLVARGNAEFRNLLRRNGSGEPPEDE